MELLDKNLNIQNTKEWPFILTSLSKIFEESGSEVPGDIFEKIMHTLAVIRERDDLFCREEIDQVSVCLDNLNSNIVLLRINERT